MQLHDILQLRTSVILPEAISDGGLAPTTDTNLFLTTYRGGSHLPSDILLFHHNLFILIQWLICFNLYLCKRAHFVINI